MVGEACCWLLMKLYSWTDMDGMGGSMAEIIDRVGVARRLKIDN